MKDTKIDVVSGFLGAGKTTFIKRLVVNNKDNEKTIIIENEFGEIGIDGGFLKDSGIEIREMNSGCICCSLAGDFEASLRELLSTYSPSRVIIEPSGVGKLSDVLKAVSDVEKDLPVKSNSAVTVVDVKKCKMYMKNFGEFFNNQIEFANTIVLSRTDLADNAKIEDAVNLIKGINPEATIVTTPLAKLSDEKIEEILSTPLDLKKELLDEMAREHEHHHDHEHHEHHHDHKDDHDHHHDEHCGHHDHEHHHAHEHHHVHNHHHADEVFDSWGMEQVPAISEDKLRRVLNGFENEERFGTVLRAKGMIKDANSDDWFYFDLVPGESNIRRGEAEYTGKVCVIGANLNEDALKDCFRD